MNRRCTLYNRAFKKRDDPLELRKFEDFSLKLSEYLRSFFNAEVYLNQPHVNIYKRAFKKLKEKIPAENLSEKYLFIESLNNTIPLYYIFLENIFNVHFRNDLTISFYNNKEDPDKANVYYKREKCVLAINIANVKDVTLGDLLKNITTYVTKWNIHELNYIQEVYNEEFFRDELYRFYKDYFETFFKLDIDTTSIQDIENIIVNLSRIFYAFEPKKLASLDGYIVTFDTILIFENTKEIQNKISKYRKNRNIVYIKDIPVVNLDEVRNFLRRWRYIERINKPEILDLVIASSPEERVSIKARLLILARKLNLALPSPLILNDLFYWFSLMDDEIDNITEDIWQNITESRSLYREKNVEKFVYFTEILKELKIKSDTELDFKGEPGVKIVENKYFINKIYNEEKAETIRYNPELPWTEALLFYIKNDKILDCLNETEQILLRHNYELVLNSRIPVIPTTSGMFQKLIYLNLNQILLDPNKILISTSVSEVSDIKKQVFLQVVFKRIFFIIKDILKDKGVTDKAELQRDAKELSILLTDIALQYVDKYYSQEYREKGIILSDYVESYLKGFYKTLHQTKGLQYTRNFFPLLHRYNFNHFMITVLIGSVIKSVFDDIILECKSFNSVIIPKIEKRNLSVDFIDFFKRNNMQYEAFKEFVEDESKLLSLLSQPFNNSKDLFLFFDFRSKDRDFNILNINQSFTSGFVIDKRFITSRSVLPLLNVSFNRIFLRERLEKLYTSFEVAMSHNLFSNIFSYFPLISIFNQVLATKLHTIDELNSYRQLLREIDKKYNLSQFIPYFNFSYKDSIEKELILSMILDLTLMHKLKLIYNPIILNVISFYNIYYRRIEGNFDEIPNQIVDDVLKSDNEYSKILSEYINFLKELPEYDLSSLTDEELSALESNFGFIYHVDTMDYEPEVAENIKEREKSRIVLDKLFDKSILNETEIILKNLLEYLIDRGWKLRVVEIESLGRINSLYKIIEINPEYLRNKNILLHEVLHLVMFVVISNLRGEQKRELFDWVKTNRSKLKKILPNISKVIQSYSNLGFHDYSVLEEVLVRIFTHLLTVGDTEKLLDKSEPKIIKLIEAILEKVKYLFLRLIATLIAPFSIDLSIALDNYAQFLIENKEESKEKRRERFSKTIEGLPLSEQLIYIIKQLALDPDSVSFETIFKFYQKSVDLTKERVNEEWNQPEHSKIAFYIDLGDNNVERNEEISKAINNLFEAISNIYLDYNDPHIKTLSEWFITFTRETNRLFSTTERLHGADRFIDELQENLLKDRDKLLEEENVINVLSMFRTIKNQIESLHQFITLQIPTFGTNKILDKQFQSRHPMISELKSLLLQAINFVVTVNKYIKFWDQAFGQYSVIAKRYRDGQKVRNFKKDDLSQYTEDELIEMFKDVYTQEYNDFILTVGEAIPFKEYLLKYYFEGTLNLLNEPFIREHGLQPLINHFFIVLILRKTLMKYADILKDISMSDEGRPSLLNRFIDDCSIIEIEIIKEFSKIMKRTNSQIYMDFITKLNELGYDKNSIKNLDRDNLPEDVKNVIINILKARIKSKVKKSFNGIIDQIRFTEDHLRESHDELLNTILRTYLIDAIYLALNNIFWQSKYKNLTDSVIETLEIFFNRINVEGLEELAKYEGEKYIKEFKNFYDTISSIKDHKERLKYIMENLQTIISVTFYAVRHGIYSKELLMSLETFIDISSRLNQFDVTLEDIINFYGLEYLKNELKSIEEYGILYKEALNNLIQNGFIIDKQIIAYFIDGYIQEQTKNFGINLGPLISYLIPLQSLNPLIQFVHFLISRANIEASLDFNNEFPGLSNTFDHIRKILSDTDWKNNLTALLTLDIGMHYDINHILRKYNEWTLKTFHKSFSNVPGVLSNLYQTAKKKLFSVIAELDPTDTNGDSDLNLLFLTNEEIIKAAFDFYEKDKLYKNLLQYYYFKAIESQYLTEQKVIDNFTEVLYNIFFNKDVTFEYLTSRFTFFYGYSDDIINMFKGLKEYIVTNFVNMFRYYLSIVSKESDIVIDKWKLFGFESLKPYIENSDIDTITRFISELLEKDSNNAFIKNSSADEVENIIKKLIRSFIEFEYLKLSAYVTYLSSDIQATRNIMMEYDLFGDSSKHILDLLTNRQALFTPFHNGEMEKDPYVLLLKNILVQTYNYINNTFVNKINYSRYEEIISDIFSAFIDNDDTLEYLNELFSALNIFLTIDYTKDKEGKTLHYEKIRKDRLKLLALFDRRSEALQSLLKGLEKAGGENASINLTIKKDVILPNGDVKVVYDSYTLTFKELFEDLYKIIKDYPKLMNELLALSYEIKRVKDSYDKQKLYDLSVKYDETIKEIKKIVVALSEEVKMFLDQLSANQSKSMTTVEKLVFRYLEQILTLLEQDEYKVKLSLQGAYELVSYFYNLKELALRKEFLNKIIISPLNSDEFKEYLSSFNNRDMHAIGLSLIPLLTYYFFNSSIALDDITLDDNLRLIYDRIKSKYLKTVDRVLKEFVVDSTLVSKQIGSERLYNDINFRILLDNVTYDFKVSNIKYDITRKILSFTLSGTASYNSGVNNATVVKRAPALEFSINMAILSNLVYEEDPLTGIPIYLQLNIEFIERFFNYLKFDEDHYIVFLSSYVTEPVLTSDEYTPPAYKLRLINEKYGIKELWHYLLRYYIPGNIISSSIIKYSKITPNIYGLTVTNQGRSLPRIFKDDILLYIANMWWNDVIIPMIVERLNLYFHEMKLRVHVSSIEEAIGVILETLNKNGADIFLTPSFLKFLETVPELVVSIENIDITPLIFSLREKLEQLLELEINEKDDLMSVLNKPEELLTFKLNLTDITNPSKHIFMLFLLNNLSLEPYYRNRLKFYFIDKMIEMLTILVKGARDLEFNRALHFITNLKDSIDHDLIKKAAEDKNLELYVQTTRGLEKVSFNYVNEEVLSLLDPYDTEKLRKLLAIFLLLKLSLELQEKYISSEYQRFYSMYPKYPSKVSEIFRAYKYTGDTEDIIRFLRGWLRNVVGYFSDLFDYVSYSNIGAWGIKNLKTIPIWGLQETPYEQVSLDVENSFIHLLSNLTKYNSLTKSKWASDYLDLLYNLGGFEKDELTEFSINMFKTENKVTSQIFKDRNKYDKRSLLGRMALLALIEKFYYGASVSGVEDEETKRNLLMVTYTIRKILRYLIFATPITLSFMFNQPLIAGASLLLTPAFLRVMKNIVAQLSSTLLHTTMLMPGKFSTISNIYNLMLASVYQAPVMTLMLAMQMLGIRSIAEKKLFLKLKLLQGFEILPDMLDFSVKYLARNREKFSVTRLFSAIDELELGPKAWFEMYASIITSLTLWHAKRIKVGNRYFSFDDIYYFDTKENMPKIKKEFKKYLVENNLEDVFDFNVKKTDEGFVAGHSLIDAIRGGYEFIQITTMNEQGALYSPIQFNIWLRFVFSIVAFFNIVAIYIWIPKRVSFVSAIQRRSLVGILAEIPTRMVKYSSTLYDKLRYSDDFNKIRAFQRIALRSPRVFLSLLLTELANALELIRIIFNRSDKRLSEYIGSYYGILSYLYANLLLTIGTAFIYNILSVYMRGTLYLFSPGDDDDDKDDEKYRAKFRHAIDLLTELDASVKLLSKYIDSLSPNTVLSLDAITKIKSYVDAYDSNHDLAFINSLVKDKKVMEYIYSISDDKTLVDMFTKLKIVYDQLLNTMYVPVGEFITEHQNQLLDDKLISTYLNYFFTKNEIPSYLDFTGAADRAIHNIKDIYLLKGIVEDLRKKGNLFEADVMYNKIYSAFKDMYKYELYRSLTWNPDELNARLLRQRSAPDLFGDIFTIWNRHLQQRHGVVETDPLIDEISQDVMKKILQKAFVLEQARGIPVASSAHDILVSEYKKKPLTQHALNIALTHHLLGALGEVLSVNDALTFKYNFSNYTNTPSLEFVSTVLKMASDIMNDDDDYKASKGLVYNIGDSKLSVFINRMIIYNPEYMLQMLPVIVDAVKFSSTEKKFNEFRDNAYKLTYSLKPENAQLIDVDVQGVMNKAIDIINEELKKDILEDKTLREKLSGDEQLERYLNDLLNR